MNARAWISTLLFALALLAGAFSAGCGSEDPISVFDSGTGQDAQVVGPTDATTSDDSPFFQNDAGTTTAITIQPADPVVDVTIADGVLSTTPLTFQAIANNTSSPVAASFTLDRGELGDLVAATGVFTASGNVSGTGTVTATFQNLKATTTVTVHVTITQNGKPQLDGGVPDGGTLGGNNGVGGNDYGDPVDNTTKTILDGQAQKPQNQAELGWLYPYDKTVWPRGVLAPLLQWQTTHTIQAVRIHLEQKNFTFDGYYAGNALINEPVDQTAWKKALYGNGGDPLHVDLYVTDGTTNFGPISEDWLVAPGTLKGTVYYNSYNSRLTTGSNGVVLSIKPGAVAPDLAVPGTDTKCHVCHEVSSDGSTLFVQDDTYSDGASYDLTNNNGTPIATYSGTASDGTSNNRKFLWSGVYPDGTFAMSNARHAREHASIDSNLFKRSDGTKIATSGWTSAVTSAVTPAFSPDGKRLAFNFWEGPGANGVTAGAGHSLDIIDFDCGQADGGKTCGSPPYAFSNLRELYKDSNRWVGWPGFTPDGQGIVFHDTVKAGSCGDCEIATWNGAQAELWYTDVAQNNKPVRMNALDGLDANNTSYLPTNNKHPDDTILNYEPTVNPIASGGYFWVVFTTRRMYGNVAAGDPYDNGNGTYPIPKKLWVAAVDINPTPGTDPSHPAFYLPGQEINAGNLRGFWVVDPCKSNGNTCETGDECCGGFCRKDPEGGGYVCTDTPPPGCSQEFEKCSSDGDCCGNPQIKCINGFCAKPKPN